MSLPNNKVPSNPPMPDTFEYLQYGGIENATFTEDYELGGVALSDSSQGQQVRVWKVRISEGGKYILLGAEGVPEILKYEAAAFGTLTEVSLAFDQNMKPTIAFVEAGQAKFLWYDSAVEAEVITTLATDVKNPRVSLDEKRPDFGTTNDVILSYLIENADHTSQNLYVRVGRDRYTVEYLIQSGVSINNILWKTGMNLSFRFQWEFHKVQNSDEALEIYLAEAPDPTTDETPPPQPPSTVIPGLDS